MSLAFPLSMIKFHDSMIKEASTNLKEVYEVLKESPLNSARSRGETYREKLKKDNCLSSSELYRSLNKDIIAKEPSAHKVQRTISRASREE